MHIICGNLTDKNSSSPIKFIQYLPVILTSLDVSDSNFRKLVIFSKWRHPDMAVWCRGGGAWHKALFLKKPSYVSSWVDVDVASNFTQTRLDCGKRVTRKISIARSQASYEP